MHNIKNEWNEAQGILFSDILVGSSYAHLCPAGGGG
jgi:hypothetical protein